MSAIEFIRSFREANAVLYWISLTQLFLIPALILGIIFDQRLILGINPWMKPLKFFLASIVFILTVGWLLKDWENNRTALFLSWLAGGAMAVQCVLVALQSLRGVPSHFNSATPFDRHVFLLLTAASVLVVIAAGWLLIGFCFPSKPMSQGYLWGIRLGLLLFLLGSVQAAFMWKMQAHTIGGPEGGPRLPFLNWSTRYGDLRIAPFLGFHALQVLPITGFILDKTGTTYPLIFLIIFASAYFSLQTIVFLQALSGKPFIF